MSSKKRFSKKYFIILITTIIVFLLHACGTKIQLKESDTVELQNQYDFNSNDIFSFSPDRDILAILSSNSSLRFFSCKTGELINTAEPEVKYQKSIVCPLKFSPDGKYIAWTLHVPLKFIPSKMSTAKSKIVILGISDGKINFKKAVTSDSKKTEIEYYGYVIPGSEGRDLPEWYLVLDVFDIGIMRIGNIVGSGGGLRGALSGLVAHAITKHSWVTWFKSRLIIIDADSREILWKCPLEGRAELEVELEDLVKNNQELFAPSLLDAIAGTAAKGIISLTKNQCVDILDESMISYKLSTEELETYTDRICSKDQQE